MTMGPAAATSALITDHHCTDNALFITWADKSLSLFHFIWLRDHCRCDVCGQPEVGRRALRLTDIDLGIRPLHVTLDTDNTILIEWPDQHVSRFPGTWLKRHAYDMHSRKRRLFKPVLWTGETRSRPPRMSYRETTENPVSFVQLLKTVRDIDLCFVEGAPDQPGIIEPFARQIGCIQESNFGRVQNLVIDSIGKSIANDVHALKPHTDEPYRASPPGLLLFHCIKTDVDGAGCSLFVDGFEAAQRLRTMNPAGFEALSHYRQCFRRHYAQEVDLVAEFPVISVDEFGHVVGVRVNDRVAAPLSIPENQVPVYYHGLQDFLGLTEDPERMMQCPLRPGDIAIFDNHRILHGRTKLSLKGKRWLQWV